MPGIDDTAGGPALRPLPRPRNPLRETSPYAAVLTDLREQVVAGLEQALRDQQAAREKADDAALGAYGVALDGAIEVRVDSKGLIQSAEFGPAVAGLTPDELAELTLAALQTAKGQLGLSEPPRDLADGLDERPVADGLMRLLREAGAL